MISSRSNHLIQVCCGSKKLHLSARNEVCCAPTRMTPRTPSQLVLLRRRWFCFYALAQVHFVQRCFFHLVFLVGKSSLLHAEGDSAIVCVCVFAVVRNMHIGIHLCGQVGEETNMSGRAYCGESPCSQRPCVTKRYAISRVKLDAACLRLFLIPHA